MAVLHIVNRSDALADCLRADFEKSPQLDLEHWRNRSLASKLTSTLAYQFRRIL